MKPWGSLPPPDVVEVMMMGSMKMATRVRFEGALADQSRNVPLIAVFPVQCGPLPPPALLHSQPWEKKKTPKQNN